MDPKTVVRGALVSLLVAFVAAGAALARKGDISPVGGAGVEVLGGKGGKSALSRLGDLDVQVRLTTKPSFFILEVGVTNKSTRSVELVAENLVLKSQGEAVDPMTPEQYIGQAYEVSPYPIDEAGRIVRDDKKKDPVKAFVPGNSTSSSSLAEMMTQEDWEDGDPGNRMRITKELLALQKDPFTIGAKVAPGKTARGRRVYQRTNVELPIVVTFQHAAGRMTVRFEREK